MIFFVSDGRLGNQIFQYAFLNTIARKGERILCLDMAEFTATFDVEGSNGRLVVLCSKLSKSRLGRLFFYQIIKPFLLFFMRTLVKTRIIGFAYQNRNKQGRYDSFSMHYGFFSFCFVDQGYFQSETFFSEKALDFKIKTRFLQKAEKFLSQIPSNYTKIFIHVRRGDYLRLFFEGEIGIDLPKTYYLKAINIINKEIDCPFFVFLSDDPQYIKDNYIEIENKLISDQSMQVDLAIMTLCDYGIIANSSFSWWGGRLMRNRKMAIVPKYWFGWKKQIEFPVGILPLWGKVLEC